MVLIFKGWRHRYPFYR